MVRTELLSRGLQSSGKKIVESSPLCSDRGELLIIDIEGDGDSGLGIDLASGREGKVAEDEEAPSIDQEHRLLSSVSSRDRKYRFGNA